MWAACGPADGSPGAAWLVRRLAWPPPSLGLRLPGDVGWIGTGGIARALRLPPAATGALVYALRDVTGGPVRALSVTAVSEDAERVEFWCGKVQSVGRGNWVFEASTGRPGDALHLCEGEADALALAAAGAAGRRVLGAGGTGGVVPFAGRLGRGPEPVVLYVDGDPGGRRAGERARRELAALGREVRIEWCGVRSDPAAELAEELAERVAILEEAGMEEAAAIEAAWRAKWGGRS